MAADLGPVHPYATLAYARTLEHVGEPRFVPAWATYVLQRRCSAHEFDAVGPYPLTMIASSAKLIDGLADLRDGGFVSATIVCDHLNGPGNVESGAAFQLAREFKQHHLVDRVSDRYNPSKHHQDRIRRAANRGVSVHWADLSNIMDEWIDLYDELIQRRTVDGAPRFSRSSFEALTKCEGLMVAGAYIDRTLVGCHLWFLHGGAAWSHLASTNELGRKNGASFALYDFSIRAFEGKVISLGGAAGLVASADDGLAAFKSGFANRHTTSYLYGAVLDPAAYKRLCDKPSAAHTDYFPAYRSPST